MSTCDLAQQVFAALPKASGTGSYLKFVGVPGVGEPRWLLPQGCRNIDSVLSNWRPYRFSSRVKWQAVRAANRVGATPSLPHSATVDLGMADTVDWRALGWESSMPPVPVVYVGTPGVCRKAVIHLVDRQSGECRLVLKVPLAERAGESILREANLLATLAEQRVRAPRLLHVDCERGIAAQQFITGTPSDRRLGSEHFGLLGSLMLDKETTSIACHAAAFQEQLQSSTIRVAPRDILQATLSELDDTHLLPSCWVHGDFAPWNVKHRAGELPMLIDWEDAHRGGLPLHDAYHFLHMQDFLFGEAPRLHCNAVEAYARTLGIAPEQCRKLETSYLAYSCLKCLSQNESARSEFLLNTMDIAVPSGRHTNLKLMAGAAQPGASHRQVQIRRELLATIITQFNAAGIRYCILGGHDKADEVGACDVDVMIHPQDIAEVAALLAQAARSAGAQLVQSMQHETTAWYFILAKQDGPDIGYLDADCCGDYRRDGRLWMRAEAIIANRRSWKDFYIPSVPDQFIYYFIKKVLKQSVTLHQFKRLRHLYARSPDECQHRLTRFWSRDTALQLQRAITQQNLASVESRMKDLLAELEASSPNESFIERAGAAWRELARRIKRAIYPTGMSLLIVGGETKQRLEVAEGLRRSMSPAFRSTSIARPPATPLELFSQEWRHWLARRQSTLVIGATENAGNHLNRNRLARWPFRPDLWLALHRQAADHPPYPNHDVSTRTIALDANLSPDQIVEAASRGILQWLTARLEGRRTAHDRTARDSADFPAVAEPIEIRTAGLD